MERNRPEGQPQPAAEAAEPYTEALGGPAEATRHIAYGSGSRWNLPDGELEHYPERGLVRLTNLREGVQITLVGQTEPPSHSPDGLVFEQPGSDRWLSVSRDGSATLFVGSAAAGSA